MQKFKFILQGTRHPGNIGAVARALKNTGFSELCLAQAECDAFSAEAWARAVHGKDILKNAQVVSSMSEALAGYELVVGFSGKASKLAKLCLSLPEWMQWLTQQEAIHRVALLFGPEDTGLVREHMNLCQCLVYIPTHENYSSLNLAQAVLLVAWELFQARELHKKKSQKEGISLNEAPSSFRDCVASFAERQALYEDVQDLLDEIGFLNPQNPEHTMSILRALIDRGLPRVREIRLLRGILRQLRWWKEQG